MTKIMLYTDTAEFYNDICEEIRIFFSADKIDLVEAQLERIPKLGLYFVHTITQEEDKGISTTALYNFGMPARPMSASFELNAADAITAKRMKKSAVKLSTYLTLKTMTGKQPPWGSLTGIRPTKLLRDWENRIGEDDAKKHLVKNLDVTTEKYMVAKRIVERQRPLIASAGDDAMDVYINIPFCPSRCAYCSFLSAVTRDDDPMQASYMDALIEEMRAMVPLTASHSIRSVYIGGGTPTSLNNDQFERLLNEVKAHIPHIPHIPEFTVEAGRPDTITPEKLAIMRRYGVTRISINPQTFSNNTLSHIGRNHTISDFNRAFQLAREFGFDHINIDLIFGLPGEQLADMKRSLNKAIRIKPESITVHTLAIKNASKLSRDIVYSEDEELVLKAVDYGRKACIRHRFNPYYMYRQKYMKGNLENVGYCRAGYESIYNIDMMEEICSVLALGAGAITKRVYSGRERLERCANVKDIPGYINRVEEMIAIKKALFEI